METEKIQEISQIEAVPAYSDLSKNSDLSMNFKNCKLIHIQILKTIYKEGKPLGFQKLYSKVKVLGADRTIREKLYDLEKWGLIEAIHTRVLIVVPVLGKEKEVIGMITGFCNQMGDTY